MANCTQINVIIYIFHLICVTFCYRVSSAFCSCFHPIWLSINVFNRLQINAHNYSSWSNVVKSSKETRIFTKHWEWCAITFWQQFYVVEEVDLWGPPFPQQCRVETRHHGDIILIKLYFSSCQFTSNNSTTG